MFSNLHTMKCTGQMRGLLSEFLSNSLSSGLVFPEFQSSVELTAQIIVLPSHLSPGLFAVLVRCPLEVPTWAAALYLSMGSGLHPNPET